MFKRITLAIALGSALSSPVFAHGDGNGHCQDTQLGNIMTTMSDDLKTYVGAFKRSDQALMQAQVAKLISNSSKATAEIPLKLQQSMPSMEGMEGMDHSNMANMSDMKNMDHSNMANMSDMKNMDHSNMANMAGMDHATHMQHMAYQQGIEKLTQLFKQLQDASSKSEVKTVLGNIKQHIKKSHRSFRLSCD